MSLNIGAPKKGVDQDPFYVLPEEVYKRTLGLLDGPTIARSETVDHLWHAAIKQLTIPCKRCDTLINRLTQVKDPKLSEHLCSLCFEKAVKCGYCQKVITKKNCATSKSGDWLGICSTCHILDRSHTGGV